MFYYAFINDQNVCMGVYALPSEIGLPEYVAITQEQYDSQSVVGKVWNASTQTWDEPIVFSCSSDEVDYKGTGTPLSAKLDAMDIAIAGKANGTDLHSHDNKNVLDGITAEKVAAWDDGTGGSGTAGADGEDGATFTPSVSAEGVLSWTNDKGLENPTPVNIKGADGADGADGVTPHIGANGNWFIGETDTGVKAQGQDGADGESGADISADDVLTKIKTVDGSGSGLDADTLDGKQASEFANANHSHTEYAATSHNHSGTYAPNTHSHSEYAASSHTHSGYASSSHTHSDYFEKSGGTITGETNFSGGLIRVNGVQAIFHSGNQLVYGSNNLPTRIAGSAISATKSITVDSDERLKENIKSADKGDMIAFIKNIDVKTFNYIGDNNECIGAIAQEVQKANPDIAKYIVFEGEDGYLGVKVADLVFPLIAAVQELQKQVDELKANK